MWEIFRKYHYLNTELNVACRQFIGCINGEIVCHTGVLPMPMRKQCLRLHRSVVLPDYQGIGIGMSFKNAVCDIIRKEGRGVQIWSTTTTPAQYHAQVKSHKWRLVRYGNATRNHGGMRGDMVKRMMQSSSRRRITYSFIYVGDEGVERM